MRSGSGCGRPAAGELLRGVLWAAIVLTLALSDCGPRAAAGSAEAVAKAYLEACQEGRVPTQETLSVLDTPVRVAAYRFVDGATTAEEKGSLDAYRAAFPKERELRAELRRLLAEERDYPAKKLQILDLKTELRRIHDSFPLLWDLQRSGRAAPFFGGMRFADLAGEYHLRLAEFPVEMNFAVAGDTTSRTGTCRLKLARMVTAGGGDSKWRVFDLVDSKGKSVLYPAALGPPTPDDPVDAELQKPDE